MRREAEVEDDTQKMESGMTFHYEPTKVMRAQRRVVFGLDGIFSAGQNKHQSKRSPDDGGMPGQAGHDAKGQEPGMTRARNMQ